MATCCVDIIGTLNKNNSLVALTIIVSAHDDALILPARVEHADIVPQLVNPPVNPPALPAPDPELVHCSVQHADPTPPLPARSPAAMPPPR